MRVVCPSSEDDMVAVFLRGELASERFGAVIAAALERAGGPRTLVVDPDLRNRAANAERRLLLADVRGYGSGEGLFAGFPPDVDWLRAALRPDELASVRFIDYDYWVELSGGTRSPADAARSIRAGVDVFGVPSSDFLHAAARFDPTAAAEPIVVTAGGAAPLVVLEGHVRLTLLALRPELVPAELEVLLGSSPRMTEWALY